MLEKERVRMILNKGDYESVFGGTDTETVISEMSVARPPSCYSVVSSKLAEAEAELAVKVEQAKAARKIQAQQMKMCKLENEWKSEEAKLLAEIKQKEAEMRSKQEEEKLRLRQMEAENDVEVAVARLKAYRDLEGRLRNDGISKSTI